MKVFDNFDVIENFMKFDDTQSYYKFCVIVRNKDGLTPLISKKSKSGEKLIKEWYVDSIEYYNRVKPEMIALANAVRGRLYMTLERKSMKKTIVEFQTYTTEVVKRLIFNDKDQIKKPHRWVRSITSDASTSEHDYRVWMYDVDAKNGFVKLALEQFLGERVQNVWTLYTPNGWHIFTMRTYKPSTNWKEYVGDLAIKLLREDYPNASIKAAQELVHIIEDIKVESNQLGLVYFNKGESNDK